MSILVKPVCKTLSLYDLIDSFPKLLAIRKIDSTLLCTSADHKTQEYKRTLLFYSITPFMSDHLNTVQLVANCGHCIAAIDRTENQILRVNIHGKRQEAIYLGLQEDVANFGAFSFTNLRFRRQWLGVLIMKLSFYHSHV